MRTAGGGKNGQSHGHQRSDHPMTFQHYSSPGLTPVAGQAASATTKDITNPSMRFPGIIRR
jgi:hypothetical protein